jgi:hypothetical protein
VFEDEYEKVVVMADGTTGNTVKTADDFAKEVAAELDAKKRKDAEKKKEDAEKNKKKKDTEKRKKPLLSTQLKLSLPAQLQLSLLHTNQ